MMIEIDIENFKKAKKDYAEQRNNQRRKIVAKLQEKGYIVVNRGRAGKGNPNYNNKNLLVSAPFDLSNWKWIEAEKEGRQFLISLQTFDIDSGSKNIHALMDRIGIYTYDGDRNDYNSFDAFSKMVITDIELPVNDEDIERLIEAMKKLQPFQKFINTKDLSE